MRRLASANGSVSGKFGTQNTMRWGEKVVGFANSARMGPQSPQAAPGDQRKIIYTAEVGLIVGDFSEMEFRLAELIKRFQGYVARSDLNRTQGEQRSGTWVVRIPVNQFDSFIEAVVQLGVPETRQTNAQDVTEEYIDLEARLANKREVEKRILKLLEERSGDIKDVVAVETELGRVREEIERMEGRLRYLQNMTALTTVTIAAREQRDYVPPQAPSFTAQISQTWNGSLETMEAAGRGIVLAFVALGPWLAVMTVVFLPAGWSLRRWRHHARQTATVK